MSAKKEKLLESAQKFILKGQLDRAIRDYEQVVALDPNDIRCRQRLAELLVRANRKDEAIGEYEAIGKYYADNGYYLKAIAVYKQVQKLDQDNIKTCMTLATLNEKQGLTGNALAEYSRVYSHFDRSGKRSDALAIIEKMIAIDPDNLNTRLKFAETHFAAGNAGKAYEDFVQIALLLKKRGDQNAYGQVCDRVAYLFPDRKEFALELAVSQLADGDAASAIKELREITKREPGNLKAWQLLAEALRTMGNKEEQKVVLQKMVRLFPEELLPREGLIQGALEDDNRESTLLLLKLHGPLFLEKGAYASLERPYLSLLDRKPGDDATILQGLKRLYEASGEEAKLAGIVDRLDKLTREEPEEVAVSFAETPLEEPEEVAVPLAETPPEEEIPLDDGSPVFSEAPTEPLPGSEWEEEIVFAPPQDEALSAIDTALEQEDYPAFGGETAQDEPAEIALELELGEDDLVDLAELYNQACADESTLHDEPAEMPEDAAAEEFPYSDLDPLADDLSLPGDDCIELEAELVADVVAEEAAAAVDYDKYSLDGLFSAFKKEIGQQLDEEDTETHYNLGIAYKEMGLYDDAIAEFQSAALDPARKVDCIILLGICWRDKGEFAKAEKIFREGIALEGMTAEELLLLKYELALLCDMAGREEEAIQLFCEINSVNPGFRDTVQRIEKIAGLSDDEAQELDELDLIEPEGEVE